jgi:TM2 domain-containing membrane protein YozV
MGNYFLTGIIAWFLPGVGHIYQGRIGRGLIIGAVVWLMFIIGVVSGGAYYPGYSFDEGALLYLLNIFARFGNGLGCLVSMFLTLNQPGANPAAWATFEYGGRFLEVAGLLNFLAVIDAVDIALGRKK